MPPVAAAATAAQSFIVSVFFSDLGSWALSWASLLFFGGIDWWFWLAIPGIGLGLGALFTSSVLPLLLVGLTIWRLKAGGRWVWIAIPTVLVSLVFFGYLMPLTLEFTRLLPDYENGREEHDLRCFGRVKDKGLNGACRRLEDLIASPLFVTAHENTWHWIVQTWTALVDRFYTLGLLLVFLACLVSLAALIRTLQQREQNDRIRQDAKVSLAYWDAQRKQFELEQQVKQGEAGAKLHSQ